MDPQQRLLLEGAWEALEDAGIDPALAAGQPDRGVRGRDVSRLRDGVMQSLRRKALRVIWVTGQRRQRRVGSRVVYVFGLEGPAVSVDTACSSSLVALHLACAGVASG